MPGVHWEVEGIKDAEKQLNKALEGMQGHSREGVRAAAAFIKKEAQDLTSIDTGELIGSAYFRTGFQDDNKNKPAAIVGYGDGVNADYAAAVHEMPDNTNWQRPGAENKFLEKAVVRNIAKIFNIIKRLSERNPL